MGPEDAVNSENPYQSPQFDTEPGSSPFSEPANRSLAWLLFSFEGRIPRRVFWACQVGITIVQVIVLLLVLEIFGNEPDVAFLALVVSHVPIAWASLAVQVKRWHDREKSAWWLLLWQIPVIGPIWTFVELGCLRGWPGINVYGPNRT